MKPLAIESGLTPQEPEGAELAESQELSPEQQVEQWRMQLTDLRTTYLRDSAFGIDLKLATGKLDGLLGHEATRKDVIRDTPAHAKSVYEGIHEKAKSALMAHEPKLGSRRLAVTEELCGAAELEGTVMKRLPAQSPVEQLFSGLFEDAHRQETMRRASKYSTDGLKSAYNNSLKKTFNPIEEEIDKAPSPEELDLESAMLVEKVADIKDDVDNAIGEIAAILGNTERRVGATALQSTMSYDQMGALMEQISKLMRTLDSPSHRQLKALASRTYCKALDLPGMTKLSSDVAIFVNRGRAYLRDALLAQADTIVAQREKGVAWQQISVEVELPWRRPAYARTIDAEIKTMRKAGIPDDKIHRRLIRRFHPDVDPKHEAAAKYISSWYSGVATKNNRDPNQDM